MKKMLMIVLVSFIGFSCSNIQKEVTREKEQVKEPVDRLEMVQRIRGMLEQSDRLTQEQKDEFMDLHAKVIEDVQGLNGDIKKLKMVLFKHLTGQSYKAKKANEIIRQIKKLNNKKIDVMTDAMVDARKILGVELEHLYPSMGTHMGADINLF